MHHPHRQHRRPSGSYFRVAIFARQLPSFGCAPHRTPVCVCVCIYVEIVCWQIGTGRKNWGGSGLCLLRPCRKCSFSSRIRIIFTVICAFNATTDLIMLHPKTTRSVVHPSSSLLALGHRGRMVREATTAAQRRPWIDTAGFVASRRV